MLIKWTLLGSTNASFQKLSQAVKYRGCSGQPLWALSSKPQLSFAALLVERFHCMSELVVSTTPADGGMEKPPDMVADLIIATRVCVYLVRQLYLVLARNVKRTNGRYVDKSYGYLNHTSCSVPQGGISSTTIPLRHRWLVAHVFSETEAVPVWTTDPYTFVNQRSHNRTAPFSLVLATLL